MHKSYDSFDTTVCEHQHSCDPRLPDRHIRLQQPACNCFDDGGPDVAASDMLSCNMLKVLQNDKCDQACVVLLVDAGRFPARCSKKETVGLH